MSTTSKTWIGIGIIVVIALVAIFALRAHAPKEAANDSEASLPTAATDTSDAALQKDSAAIDTQLNGLDSDNATVNEGISETQ